MAVVIQYEFNTEGQWKNAGLPKLVDTADEIIVLGRRTNAEGNPTGKYHVEVLFEGELPENGLLAAKAVEPIPHQFIGYPNLSEFEEEI